MKKIILASALLLLGFGCNQNQPVTTTDQLENTSVTSGADSELGPAEITPSSTPTTGKLAVKRTFILDEIETTGGGLKNWFRDLARANVAGTKTLVRVPINRVHGFGCLTPTPFCVSTQEGGCFGPFVDLKGKNSEIMKTHQACLNTCNNNKSVEKQVACTADFMDSNCSVLWEAEGYVVAASKVPEAKDDGTPGTCADGELLYDFEVTRVIQKIPNGAAEDFIFYEYK